MTLVAGIGEGNAGLKLAAHQMSYEVSLLTREQTSDVIDASGESEYVFSDTCDGWTTTDNTKLYLNYESGKLYEIVSSSSAFEDKKGKKFEFRVHRTDPVEEHYTGEVRSNFFKYRREAVFEPFGASKQKFPLDKDVLFPVQFILNLLQAAMEGENYMLRQVFDGTEIQGASSYSAVIGKTLPPNHGHELLHGKRAWPIHLAFFDDSKQSGEILPDYEVDFVLYENGVTDQIDVDYGDFIIRFQSRDFRYLETRCD